MLKVLALHTYYSENCSRGLHKYTFTRVIGVQKSQQINLALLAPLRTHPLAVRQVVSQERAHWGPNDHRRLVYTQSRDVSQLKR